MDKKTRIAVFVSGGGTNLQAIIDAEKSGIIKSGKTELVISDNPEAYALERAKANGIKTAVVLKNNGQAEFEKKISEILAENKNDYSCRIYVHFECGFHLKMAGEDNKYPSFPHTVLLRKGLLWAPCA